MPKQFHTVSLPSGGSDREEVLNIRTQDMFGHQQVRAQFFNSEQWQSKLIWPSTRWVVDTAVIQFT